ncbi:MAG: hypothetical protein M1838_003267 [Thelocarpon superellum]|nr:MAG: hypothetical protein M1838_003267 [Thelocarpon superellum]
MKTKAKLLPVGALLTLFAAGAVSARRGGSPKENVAIHRRQAQQQSSSVPITITPQNVALMQVVIGGQTLQLEPDTGSYDLWVTSTEATTPAPPNQTLFDPTKSTTFKALPGDSLTISYGDGTSLSGGVGADTVQLGSLAVMGQPVGLPSNYQEGLQTGSDGILGLGPDSTNLLQPAGQKTFLQNLEPILAQPLFAVNFNSPTAGSIDFGAIDTTQFTGTLTNVTVESTQHLWQVAVSDVSAGGKSLGSAGGQVASIDTGSNAIFLPQPVVAAYYATIPQASGELQDGIEAWVMPCTTTPTDLTITINNNYQAVVPGSNLDFIRTNATHCAGGVMDVAFGGGDMALGLPFLKAQYVVAALKVVLEAKPVIPKLRLQPPAPRPTAPKLAVLRLELQTLFKAAFQHNLWPSPRPSPWPRKQLSLRPSLWPKPLKLQRQISMWPARDGARRWRWRGQIPFEQ